MKKGVFFASVACALHVPSYAQDGDQGTQAGAALASEVATSSGKFGITLVRGFLQSQPGARYIPPPDSGTAGDAIADVVNSYSSQRARMQGEITIVAGTVDRLADITAAATIYGTGGAGAVPVALVRAAVQAGTDDYFAGAREKADDSMRAFLARNRTKIEKDAGLTYEQLRARSPEEIRQRLDAGTTTFKDLDTRVSDPNVRTLARDLIVNSIINTQKATLDQIGGQGAAILDIKGRLGTLYNAHDQLADLTARALAEQQKSIAGLEGAVQDLDTAVQRVDQRLSAQERNMGFVQDLLFDNMPAAKKAAVLRSGFMANRFACPDGGNTCDQANLKSDLIARFESEARVQTAIASAGKVLEAANGVLQIATNLGIKPGAAGDAVKYGTVAFNAFTSFATGNYIGAIASITGAFGSSGPDPQIEFLKQQFSVINQKLDMVLENQVKLSNQITSLSARLDQHVAQLNGRLNTIEKRIERVRRLQAATFNANWQACQQMYTSASDPRNAAVFGFDLAQSSFASVEKASSFGLSYGSNVDQCITIISARPTSLALADWFGSFLNADTSLAASDEDLDAVDRNRKDVWLLVSSYAASHSVDLWRAYQMYAAPARSVRELRARRAATIPPGDPCSFSSGALAKDRLRDLLCEATPGNAPNPSAAAANGLRSPMLSNRAITVAGWVLVEQALVDVRAVRKTGPAVTAAELLRFNPGGAPKTQGEEHCERAMLTLDAAVANSSMLHGDLTIEAVLDVLASTKLDDTTREAERLRRLAAARAALVADGFLARNVLNAFLNDRYGIYIGAQKQDKKPNEGAYRAALKFVETSTTGDPYAYLSSLFGPGLVFQRDQNGRAGLQLLAADGEAQSVVVPLPEPMAFASGRFYYPEELRALEAKREQVGTRLLDYRAFREVLPEKRLAVVKALARSELTRID